MNASVKSIILMALMFGSAILAWVIHPRISMADQRTKVDLATLIPHEFGSWKVLEQSSQLIVNPQQTAELTKLYSQTFSRSYINTDGAVVMLSIAYGADQSRDLQIHRPEVCYSAQGFQLLSTEKSTIEVASKSIPAMHIVAKLGQRNEPITYWVRIGEKVVRGNLEQGFARLSYGLSGKVADGLLFRVSSIDNVTPRAFETQANFVRDLAATVSDAHRQYLFGSNH